MNHPYNHAVRVLKMHVILTEMKRGAANTGKEREFVEEQLDQLQGAIGFLESHADEIYEGLN